MQLVEQHCIHKGDPRYEALDRTAFASKNLYNLANYHVRQSFIFEGKYLGIASVFHLVKKTDAYQALPAKVANDVLRLLDKNWRSFFATIKEWNIHPEKFLGRPALPKYKDKQHGRNILVYDIQALSKKGLKQGLIQPSKLGISIPTQQCNIKQARIVPRHGHYVVEIVYERKETQADVHPALIAAVDIGVNNLAALTSNKPGFTPLLVNGRPLKSINQYYNKRHAQLQSQLMRMDAKRRSSHQMEHLTFTRTRRIDHYLHTASKRMIDLLVEEGIGTLIIGKNPNWKQECEMRKKDTQHFVQIPHARFVDMLCYKAKLVGIQVILQEESYTSKASFLDSDPLPTYGSVEGEPTFSGRRVKRGLYRASGKRFLNADVNGSYNILRKASPNGFPNGVEAVAVQPRRLAV
jgi:putative transposase